MGGYVFGVVTDNLSVNEKAFKSLQKTYAPRSIYAPLNILLKMQFFLHLIKNIRNNWVSEKTRTLEFLDPDTNEKIVAKWVDLIHIYKAEENNMVRKITIDYQTLYPNNFEWQKVQLVHGRNETARFVEIVTRMWKILNIKTPDAGHNLNDKDRKNCCYR